MPEIKNESIDLIYKDGNSRCVCVFMALKATKVNINLIKSDTLKGVIREAVPDLKAEFLVKGYINELNFSDAETTVLRIKDVIIKDRANFNLALAYIENQRFTPAVETISRIDQKSFKNSLNEQLQKALPSKIQNLLSEGNPPSLYLAAEIIPYLKNFDLKDSFQNRAQELFVYQTEICLEKRNFEVAEYLINHISEKGAKDNYLQVIELLKQIKKS